MQLSRKATYSLFDSCLNEYVALGNSLPGLELSSSHRNSFVKQLVDSARRVEYFYAVQNLKMSADRKDPASEMFDPIRAAVLHLDDGGFDEACWLTFLAVHFGKHRRNGWRLLRDVYGALGQGSLWDWSRSSTNQKALTQWIAHHEPILNGGDGVKRGFGNHRKYTSLKSGPAGTGAAIESYVGWIKHHGGHEGLRDHFTSTPNQSSGTCFDLMYKSMEAIQSFGRVGRFDFLCMLGKLGAFPVEPNSLYLSGATGPRRGASLILTGVAISDLQPKKMDKQLILLGSLFSKSGVPFSMQILEDALCNWQKSPSRYICFRG